MALWKRTIKQIESMLEKDGLTVSSYKPDRVRLYQVGRKGEFGTVTPITRYMKGKELKIWFSGYWLSKTKISFESGIPSQHARKG